MRIRHTAFPWVRGKVASDIHKIFVEKGKLKNFRKGDYVVPAGGFYPNLALVVSGLMSKSFEVAGSSKCQAMSVLLPGAIFGESFFMSRRASNLAVRALRDSIILELGHDVIEGRMASNPNFLRRILDQFMLDTESDLEGLATLIARGHDECLKLLFKIFVVREKVPLTDGWYSVPLNLSHQEISRIIFVTPLTINRILHSWKKQGLYQRVGTNRFFRPELFANISDWKGEEFLGRDHS